MRTFTKTIAGATLSIVLAASTAPALAGGNEDRSWIADQGDGTYINPIIGSDYSDPDAVRVGDDYYLTASSFSNFPGLPILHSRDLVNWTLIGHALPEMPVPEGHFDTPRRGGGVWAPTILYHEGEFRIYWADPDFGVFLVRATDPAGPWSKPVLVADTKGMIDPAPLFDEDGRVWMAYAFAQSRAGFQNVIELRELNSQGTKAIGKPIRIFDGNSVPGPLTSIGQRPWQTTEGPKLYKRDGWYWLFAPSGSVKGGWQGVFRARKITGPWQGRNVLDQGPTEINGPHQGSWLRTQTGEDWFIHFQDTDSFGRRVFLEPMRWTAQGWPVIGADPDGDGIGQPVLRYAKPDLPRQPRITPEIDDEFEGGFNLTWQWQSQPNPRWWDEDGPDGWLRLRSASTPVNLWDAGNLLSRKLPAESFTATTRMRFSPLRDGERAGLAMFGMNYGWIGAEKTADGLILSRGTRLSADAGGKETLERGPFITPGQDVWLRLTASPVTVENPIPDFSPWWPSMLRSRHAEVSLAYSLDGTHFTPLGASFQSRPGRWVGAQLAIFAQAPSGTPAYSATTVGHADFDWFRLADTE